MSAVDNARAYVARVLEARAAVLAANKAVSGALAEAYAEAARGGFPEATVDAVVEYVAWDEDDNDFTVRVSFGHRALHPEKFCRPFDAQYHGMFANFDLQTALAQVRKDAERRAEVVAVLREYGIDVFRDTPDPGRPRRPWPGAGNAHGYLLICRGMAFRLPLYAGPEEVRRVIRRALGEA